MRDPSKVRKRPDWTLAIEPSCRRPSWLINFPDRDIWGVWRGSHLRGVGITTTEVHRRTPPPLQSISLEIQPSRCSLFPSSAKAVETIIVRETYLVDAFGSGFGC